MDDMNWEEQNRKAMQAAYLEGGNRARSLGRLAKERGFDVREKLWDVLCGMATDDSWSGRGNDAKRAHRDGFVAAAQTIYARAVWDAEEAAKPRAAGTREWITLKQDV